MYVCYSKYPNVPTCITVEESQANKQPSTFGINHSRHFYYMQPAEVYFRFRMKGISVPKSRQAVWDKVKSLPRITDFISA